MRVVVLGAGYAGVTACRRLERHLPEAVGIVLVDERDTHLVQHQLHRVIRRPDLAAEVQVPLERLFDRVTLVRAHVGAVDYERGVATLDSDEPSVDPPPLAELTGPEGETLDWDVGIVCLGARTADYGLPGVPEHGRPLKRLDDALGIHEAVKPLVEAGEGRVVVGGGGLSGVQAAGELAAWATSAGADDLRVILLERAGTVAPGFPDEFQAAIARTLREQGVTVETGATVVAAGADHVELADGRRVDADELVWTGGIRGPDAFEAERPTVRADLQLGPDTFGVGDAVRIHDAAGEPVPATAQAAVAGAKTAAENAARRVEYHLEGGVFEPRLARFRFEPRGWVVSVGDDAVAMVGGEVVTGHLAAELKSRVGTAYRRGTVGAAVDAVVDAVTGRP